MHCVSDRGGCRQHTDDSIGDFIQFVLCALTEQVWAGEWMGNLFEGASFGHRERGRLQPCAMRSRPVLLLQVPPRRLQGPQPAHLVQLPHPLL